MSIQSLGVGSGLDLESLVTQLLEAERAPKTQRLDAREEQNEAEISALGQINSRLSEFRDSIDELRRDTDISGREPNITNPDAETDIITANAANSALTGNYEIQVTELATGTRIQTDDGDFASSSDSVLSAGSGSLTFKIGNTGDSFSINVSSGTTLAQLREQINDDENNFGVTANIIDTGTAAGAKLIFTSDVTGTSNDLVIVNDDDLADLERLSTTNSTEDPLVTYLSPFRNAGNAVAFIDGLEVQSETNEFENTIQGVSFTAERESPFDTDGTTRIASRLSIGFDREGLDGKIRDFIENYNSLIQEINRVTRFGESDLEEDGALAGDSLIRGIQTSLANIVGDRVSTSTLGGLFQLGIELNENSELEIGATDFGLGSGQQRLNDALDDNFDDIATLFTDSSEGIATRLYEFVSTYTRSGGLIDSRENAARDVREQILDERETLELRLLNTEQILRDRYLNLDQTVSRLNSTGAALFAALA